MLGGREVEGTLGCPVSDLCGDAGEVGDADPLRANAAEVAEGKVVSGEAKFACRGAPCGLLCAFKNIMYEASIETDTLLNGAAAADGDLSWLDVVAQGCGSAAGAVVRPLARRGARNGWLSCCWGLGGAGLGGWRGRGCGGVTVAGWGGWMCGGVAAAR